MADEKLGAKDCLKGYFGNHWRGLCIFLVPILLLPIMLMNFDIAFRCMWVVCLMTVFWLTEMIPLAITSLFPIVLFPLLGILDIETVCKQYFKDPLIMFMGGLIVALAIEYCNLHKRVALGTIKIVGCRPRRLHAGLTIVTAFMSIWFANAAATAMMCPVIKAVLEELGSQGLIKVYRESDNPDEPPEPSNIALSYYLGVAYGSSIGGCGSLIGTSTNLTLKGLYDERFPGAKDTLDFPIYMGYAMPIVIIDTILLCFVMQVQYLGLFRKNSAVSKEIQKAADSIDSVNEYIRGKYKELGPMTCHEIQVLVIFILMILLLFSRKPGFIPGWADILNTTSLKSSLPCVFCVLLMFFLPIHYGFCRLCCARPPYPNTEIRSVISWKYVNAQLPWGLIFLLGGGYALAEGSQRSGMAKLIGEQLGALKDLPKPVILLILVLIALILTNFSSNNAVCNIMVPVLCEMSLFIKVHPLYLIFPVGLVCSMAFHLPVSTPPNAIIAGYANIKSKYILIGGCLPSIISLLVVFLIALTWSRVIYPDIDSFPDWIQESADKK